MSTSQWDSHCLERAGGSRVAHPVKALRADVPYSLEIAGSNPGYVTADRDRGFLGAAPNWLSAARVCFDLLTLVEMTDTIFGNGTDQWVCPNDRQLALRAKLQTGWSVHTFQTEKQRKSQSLNDKELEIILRVIKRAERLEQNEQLRIGRLVERLENVRKNVMGNGLSQCLLCGELLGLLGTPSVFCQDCTQVSRIAN
ncbi:UNVERIFIED_CONTAM: hypothetical protein FKN15_061589 [Acipenser sinensis]